MSFFDVVKVYQSLLYGIKSCKYRVSFYRQLIGQTSAIILPLTHFVRDPLYGAERPVIFGADRPTRGGSTRGGSTGTQGAGAKVTWFKSG